MVSEVQCRAARRLVGLGNTRHVNTRVSHVGSLLPSAEPETRGAGWPAFSLQDALMGTGLCTSSEPRTLTVVPGAVVAGAPGGPLQQVPLHTGVWADCIERSCRGSRANVRWSFATTPRHTSSPPGGRVPPPHRHIVLVCFHPSRSSTGRPSTLFLQKSRSPRLSQDPRPPGKGPIRPTTAAQMWHLVISRRVSPSDGRGKRLVPGTGVEVTYPTVDTCPFSCRQPIRGHRTLFTQV